MNALSHARRLLVTGLLSTFASGIVAQQRSTTPDKSQTPTTPATPATRSDSSGPSTDARLVSLPVVVRDKKGALVQNLTKSDFSLQVDGKPQTIRSFDKDTNLPLSLGLLVDTSLSLSKVLDEERAASSAFLDQMLTTSKDKAFLAQFSRQTELLQDLTPSHPLLQAALKEIGTSDANPSSPNTDSPNTDSSGNGSAKQHHGATTLYDALFLTSDEIMSKQTGRKVVVILSDGVDNGSKETLAHAIETAQRADTIIYAIYLKGDESHPMDNGPRHSGGGYPGGYPGGGYPGGGYPGGGYPGGGYPGGGYPGGGYPGGGYPGTGGSNGGGTTGRSHIDGRKVLERMAQETGGRVFDIKRNQDFAQIYNQIAEDLRAQYRLGYTPSQDAASSGYHQVDLIAAQKELSVQTRDGYYGGK